MGLDTDVAVEAFGVLLNRVSLNSNECVDFVGLAIFLRAVNRLEKISSSSSDSSLFDTSVVSRQLETKIKNIGVTLIHLT